MKKILGHLVAFGFGSGVAAAAMTWGLPSAGWLVAIGVTVVLGGALIYVLSHLGHPRF